MPINCQRATLTTLNLKLKVPYMMEVNLDDLVPFEEICRKINLNIPTTYIWRWDAKRHMAVVVLEEEDAELAFYPLFKEFQNHWNFDSAPEADKSVIALMDEKYGLMPGQVSFTSHVLSGLVLAVAWWPWGSERKVSMRIGLIPVDGKQMGPGVAHDCLNRWLPMNQTET